MQPKRLNLSQKLTALLKKVDEPDLALVLLFQKQVDTLRTNLEPINHQLTDMTRISRALTMKTTKTKVQHQIHDTLLTQGTSHAEVTFLKTTFVELADFT